MVEVGNLEIGGSIDTKEIESGLNKIKTGMGNVGDTADKTSKKMEGMGIGKLGKIGNIGAIGGLVAALTALAGTFISMGQETAREMFKPHETETPISSAFAEREKALETRGAIQRDIGRVEVFENRIKNIHDRIEKSQSEAGKKAQEAANKAAILWDDVTSDIEDAITTGFAPGESISGAVMSTSMFATPGLGQMWGTLTGSPTKGLLGPLSPIVDFILGLNNKQNKKEAEQSTPDGSGDNAWWNFWDLK